MKKFLVNIFATTGISLLLLAVVALAFHAGCIYVQTVFQVFGANAVAHLGLSIVGRLELKYASIEAFGDIALIVFVLLYFGEHFDWFASTPAWVLAVMGFVMYVISVALNVLRMRQEAQKINSLIQKRNLQRTEQI